MPSTQLNRFAITVGTQRPPLLRPYLPAIDQTLRVSFLRLEPLNEIADCGALRSGGFGLAGQMRYHGLGMALLLNASHQTVGGVATKAITPHPSHREKRTLQNIFGAF